jgi:nicotinamidase-related amidase
MRTGLFVIDPQNDFCSPTGSLYVAGADQDMSRLAKLIDKMGKNITDMFVTMDTHHIFDIAHAQFWIDQRRKHPDPFTIISVDDVAKKLWMPSNSHYNAWAKEYVEGLAQKGRFPLCIWPDHCLIGSPGNNIYPELFTSLCNWERTFNGFVQYQTKGTSFKTEHYSIFEAEYSDPADPTTKFNGMYANAIAQCDKVLIAGEARTHCVINSMRSLIENMGDSFISKIIFLEDASSDVTVVPGLVAAADQYFADLKRKGMEVTTTAEFMK